MKNIQSTFFLKGTINKQPGLSRPGIFQNSKMMMMSTALSSLMDPSALIRSVKIFFDLKPPSVSRCSRIRRRYNKSFDEFIFKGYDQQTPGLSRPGSFKDLKMICKN
ncbi:MAG TPA: hypothetical protein VM101_00800 [Flavitalea sp.]|nr:hypothetical protein [Flavitalea sp.]